MSNRQLSETENGSLEGCRSLFLKVTKILEIEIDTYARFDSERKIRTCRP